MLVLKLGRKEKIDHLTFALDGGTLAASGDFGVRLWRSLADGDRAERLTDERWLGAARFTPADDRWLFAASNHSVYRIHTANGGCTASMLWGGDATWVEVSPVAPLILVAQVLSIRLSRLACWHADDLSPAGKVWERSFRAAGAHRPRFLPGGKRLAHLEGVWAPKRQRNEFRAVISDAATGEPLGPSDADHVVGYDSLLSPDGNLFAVRATTGVEVYPVAGGPNVELRNDNKKHFTGVAFHPGGRFLAVTSNDATVKLYDTTTWELTRTFTWDIGKMRSIAFSPDGTLAAAGSDKGQVIVWDVDG